MTPSTNGKAEKKTSTFRMACGVSIRIAAPADRVWKLLTGAEDFPRWNSTVTSIEGPIALGHRLKLRVPISPRTFTPKVTELVPSSRMVWSDGAAPMFKGVRTYTLSQAPDGGTEFTMVEELRGIMLPMVKGSLPDFGPAFEQYAADLKREAEKVS